MSANWDRDCTMRYLNEYPLPEDFRWPHRDGGERAVWPVHSVVTGYGKWLRETPYFPGLFELVHDLVANVIALRPDELRDGIWLSAELEELRKKNPDCKPAPGAPLANQLRRRVSVDSTPSLF